MGEGQLSFREFLALLWAHRWAPELAWMRHDLATFAVLMAYAAAVDVWH